jgi:hemerythrin superfamily protein
VMETDEVWAAEIRRTRHIGDFRKWKDHDEYQKAFGRLMRDLKAEEKGEEKMVT